MLWAVPALLASLLPLETDRVILENILHTPNWQQWFGHDDLGRSILSRLIMDARTSLFISVIVISISFSVGIMLGVLGAWAGWRLGQIAGN